MDIELKDKKVEKVREKFSDPEMIPFRNGGRFSANVQISAYEYSLREIKGSASRILQSFCDWRRGAES